MSLIDEALKRAELEAARRDGLRGGTYPWVPEHTPKRRRRWALGVSVVVFAGVATGAGVWLLRRAAPVPAPVQGPRSKVQGSPTKTMETVEVAPPPVGLPTRETERASDPANATAGKESQRPTPPYDTARARIAPAREPGPPGVPAEKASKGFADGKTYVGQVNIPDGGKIELGGIVYSETSPVALINDKVLPPGAIVEEFTIVSIKPDRVELNGRGVTIFLTLK